MLRLATADDEQCNHIWSSRYVLRRGLMVLLSGSCYQAWAAMLLLGGSSHHQRERHVLPGSQFHPAGKNPMVLIIF